ncbi:DUF664 domain-containing protein [Nocardioides marinquilinus]
MTETPWEPPFAADEQAHLLGALDRMRATFRFKTDDLDADGLRARVGASSLTLGGLLKHLAAVEDFKSTVMLTGDPIGEPWESLGYDASNEWELESAAADAPATLYGLWDDAVRRSRARFAAVLATGGLGAAVHADNGEGDHASARRLLFDLLEEYGRHCGHADLLREAVDGRVGEDPPPGWRPVGGAPAPWPEG